MTSHEIRTASSTGGEKGTKLARFDLMPVEALEEVASRFGLGAMKYENRNWERGYEWSKSYGALQRHAWAFWRGEDDDDLGEEAYRAAGLNPEDFKVDGRIPGSSHLAAIACHALFLLHWSRTHTEFDDRPSTEAKKEEITLPELHLDFDFKGDADGQQLIQILTGGGAMFLRGDLTSTGLQQAPVLAEFPQDDDADNEDDFIVARAMHRATLQDWHNRPVSEDILPTFEQYAARPTMAEMQKQARLTEWMEYYGDEIMDFDGFAGLDTYALITRQEYLNGLPLCTMKYNFARHQELDGPTPAV